MPKTPMPNPSPDRLERALRDAADRHWEGRLDPMLRAKILRAARSTERRSYWLSGALSATLRRRAFAFAACGALLLAVGWRSMPSGGTGGAGSRPDFAPTNRFLEVAQPGPAPAQSPSRRGRPPLGGIDRPAAPALATHRGEDSTVAALPRTMGAPASVVASAPNVRRPPLKLSTLSRARRAAKSPQIVPITVPATTSPAE